MMMDKHDRYPHGYRFSRVEQRSWPQLHLVAGPPYSLTHVRNVCRQVYPFVDRIHLRLKAGTSEQGMEWACRLLETGAARPEQLVINGMPEVARYFGAGLHLPEAAPLPAGRLRVTEGRDRVAVGVSVHSPDTAEAKEVLGADYLYFGHVYPSPSKPGLPPRGIEMLKETVARVSIPVIAIGGIDDSRLEEVAESGCAGAAVISALMEAADPGKAAWAMRQAMERYWT